MAAGGGRGGGGGGVGRWWWGVGGGSGWREVLMCVNTLKATGPVLADGLSPVNYCMCDRSSTVL